MKRLKRLFFWLILIFIVLYIFRLAYGYTKTFDDTTYETAFFENISSSKRNYASKKYKVQSNNVNQTAIKVDQKYEKIAEIKTKSSSFEQEEASSRKTIEQFNALIQFEQKSGNKGYRKLNLVVGVPPENFDSLYNKLIKIGKVQAKQITKKDKTNEYKELNAKKQSLEKIRNSLIDLKSKGGKIEEYMGLENRILEIEQQLQGLGVSLGDFDDENEFCTVQFSLLEGKEVKIGLMQRMKVALEWTVSMYLQIITILFFITLFAYLILLVIDKLQLFERILNKK
ncbi:DUF4349 domain-containing protein [Ichthyenterobacterium sp. W332]|uniref:DUF4349 domain-containing protein n=1 Tax=Microcosmobacter mediterraneus TaxID=3075607 RepID=A0ABU2YMY1_9FLAO|nr:DUF4349 domain-containing protein [Ichthyenterobacterium sp. W332]MDT0559172.1 DUF4349 domain-containing protein [Ichthyenterobacterium sp. W332]